MVRKYYIEAYYANDTPILGNLDGQGVIYATLYKRTQQYKELFNRVGRMKRVAYYLIIDAISNKAIERIDCKYDAST
jgi:hypothetical protein